MIISPETIERMSRLTDEHNVHFHIARIAKQDGSACFDCVVRDAVGQVVAKAEGGDRTEAVERAMSAIDLTVIGRSMEDIARELAVLRANLASVESRRAKS